MLFLAQVIIYTFSELLRYVNFGAVAESHATQHKTHNHNQAHSKQRTTHPKTRHAAIIVSLQSKPAHNFSALPTSLSYRDTFFYTQNCPLSSTSWEVMLERVEMDRYFPSTSVFFVNSYATNGLHTSI